MSQHVEAAHPGRPSLQDEIEQLAPWFHNLRLPDGTQTAPDHFLGDFPLDYWQHIGSSVPADLTGWSVLDIGCNAGYYSFELARRGARVTAIDVDEHYLRQARWAARQYALEDRIEFRRMQVYHLAQIDEQFDLVWFMGVLYHLRHPLLALDIMSRRARKLMMFQTMTMPGQEIVAPPDDFPLGERDRMLQPGWPVMGFIEKNLAGDPTNWWAPNLACVEAMLRDCGFAVLACPAREVYLCQRIHADGDPALTALREEEYRAATGQSLNQTEHLQGIPLAGAGDLNS
jgi:tRNA (mo5U34)-methyltransferase